jgi:hypothetical protein
MRVDSVILPTRVLIDPEWLRTWNNADAGPYRFLKNPPPLRAQPPRDTTPKPQRRRPPRTPRPLGVPVPMPGGGR